MPPRGPLRRLPAGLACALALAACADQERRAAPRPPEPPPLQSRPAASGPTHPITSAPTPSITSAPTHPITSAPAAPTAADPTKSAAPPPAPSGSSKGPCRCLYHRKPELMHLRVCDLHEPDLHGSIQCSGANR